MATYQTVDSGMDEGLEVASHSVLTHAITPQDSKLGNASPASTSNTNSKSSSILSSSPEILFDAPQSAICSSTGAKRVARTKNDHVPPLVSNKRRSRTDSNPPLTNNFRANRKSKPLIKKPIEDTTGLEGLMQATALEKGTTANPPPLNADVESCEAWVIPALEPKHKEYKDENGLKNDILRVMLRKGIAKSPNLDHGYVYIFWSPAFPGHVKIGSTKQSPAQRINQWQTKCKFKCIHVADINDKSFKQYRIAEAIIHAELWNRRRKMYCTRCKSGHRLALIKGGKGQRTERAEHSEWFEISCEEALEVVKKWRNWVIHCKPYSDGGTLRSAWRWKHDLGTRLSGTEAEWQEWRQFTWVDAIKYWENSFEWWMGKVSPPFREIVDTPGSKSAFSAVNLLFISGLTFRNFIIIAFFYFLYKCHCFKHR